MTTTFDSISRREALKRVTALLGVAISPSILVGLARAQAGAGGGAKQRYLTAQQRATVAAAAERILPRTDTPGAIDVGVPAFIDLMLAEFVSPEEQRGFAQGLADLDAASTRAHRKTFDQLSPAAQDAILTDVARAAQDKEKTFFHQLKELTLVGYFTSEQIGRHVTHYDPIPGAYRGCVSLAEVGNKAWTR